MDNLGRRYEVGRGVQNDYCEAVRWYRRAASGGYKESIEYLRQIGEGSGGAIGGRWLTPSKLVFDSRCVVTPSLVPRP
jgi:TPR repeat protein